MPQPQKIPPKKSSTVAKSGTNSESKSYSESKSEFEDTRPKIDTTNLRRKRETPDDSEQEEKAKPVSAGPVDKAIELAFNPTWEKLPEVTIIDKFQGRLFPLVTLVDIIWDDCLQIALYRQSKTDYQRVYKKPKPVSNSWLGELLHSTAQWQKSIGGTNLTKITDIALAEMENNADEDGEGLGGADAWGKE